jgi:hypothetical protein
LFMKLISIRLISSRWLMPVVLLVTGKGDSNKRLVNTSLTPPWWW